MTCCKPASIAFLLACWLAVADARTRDQQLPEPAEKAAPASAPSSAAPAKARKPKPVKRRSVQQVIEPTPRIVTEPYRPILEVRPPVLLPQTIPGPVRMNSCDGAGCTDVNGNRFNGGVGTTLIGPQGQLCNKGLVNAQCF
jgi:hypothetical protein